MSSFVIYAHFFFSFSSLKMLCLALQLVISTGNGVNGFTLDPSLGEFILTHPDIKVSVTVHSSYLIIKLVKCLNFCCFLHIFSTLRKAMSSIFTVSFSLIMIKSLYLLYFNINIVLPFVFAISIVCTILSFFHLMLVWIITKLVTVCYCANSIFVFNPSPIEDLWTLLCNYLSRTF